MLIVAKVSSLHSNTMLTLITSQVKVLSDLANQNQVPTTRIHTSNNQNYKLIHNRSNKINDEVYTHSKLFSLMLFIDNLFINKTSEATVQLLKADMPFLSLYLTSRQDLN